MLSTLFEVNLMEEEEEGWLYEVPLMTPTLEDMHEVLASARRAASNGEELTEEQRVLLAFRREGQG